MISARNVTAICCRRILSTSSYTVRTHICDELSTSNKNEKVSVMGWLSHKRMDRFFVLRDAYGSVQAKISASSKLQSLLKDIPYESVVRVDGIVVDRGDNRNSKMKTGDIEIDVEELTVLNKATSNIPMLPDANANERTRLKYRYIDLRSDKLQKSLRLRSEFVHNVRRFLVEKSGFVDVETPTLFRRTPGGAAEFVVPAPSPNQGLAYSLPQSPQQFKQLLMVGAIDRYFQIARCYRDEGSKGDRQPEFTQVDVEMSFTTQNGVMQLIEDMIISAWPESLNHIKPKSPFPRIPYSDAMRLYGIDKPDMRIPWQIDDVDNDIFEFLQKDIDDDTWRSRILVCRGAGKTTISNSMKNEWKRLIQMNENGKNFAICHPSQKRWFKPFDNQKLIDQFGLIDEDVLIVCWGNSEGVYWTLEVCGLRSKSNVTAHWIVDFPLFSFEEGQLVSTHHPFTAPLEKDIDILYSNDIDKLLQITGQHYDLVINGVEMGGGSIRIENSEIQRHVLKVLGEPTDEMEHLLNALSHGAPPHGGFALGLDRFVAMLTSDGNPLTPVRDVIAFPKTKNGKDLMSDAPATLSQKQLERYGISLLPNAVE
ncbi:Aminoacyl-transfer RNA synthetases class-II family profile domain-containing protein [Caenorhabditis elegans]|uniref:Aminoacyl-transfer RNA synthetases class-II family profile domain-containing protein n=1 Tax=Caenorhabditis elegans TaxID=6239 RepID=P90831_CAEEL|nr:Aminoacyl-transfer RNA synthetases class-II family profile domain-containing protein [Caenorhabditis elegans]CAB04081.2 Aminoacyl-transfer RNA synthetases class-II family profile domain-containing protein [Caenorhabditis elegans]|eukprot:NP_506019.2 aspartyl(D) Amino-acyl tRNA Synthetase [Caenorhabditis elegans]